MDNVENLYYDGKLLARGMEMPMLCNGVDKPQYDCTTWANEFNYLMNGTYSSASSTLLVPGVGVRTYKGIGFLVNSDTCECIHVSKSDSLSSGNANDGDFQANDTEFNKVSELANYIKENESTDINEVNINASLDSVVGLFLNHCPNEAELLQMIYVVKESLENMTGIDYPIYLYDPSKGLLQKADLSLEDEKSIQESLETTQIMYWPDDWDEPVVEDMENIRSHTK